MSEAATAEPRRGSARETSGLPVVLVGPPNVGKSAMFGALTRSYVTVSNYPGTTVEFTRGATMLDGVRVPVVDTPGVLSLLPTSEEERATRDILLTRSSGPVVVVADAIRWRPVGGVK